MINFNTAPQTGASSSAQNRKRKEPDSPSRTSAVSPKHKKQKDIDSTLEAICKTSPAILQTAVDDFIRAPKGSDAAMQAADKIDLALAHDSDPNQPGSPILTHLSKAIIHDRPWLFKKLLNHQKTDINLEPKVGRPAIHTAIRTGNITAFQELMKRNATVSHQTLGMAVLCGQPEMLEILFTKMPEMPNEEKELQRTKAQQQQKRIEHHRTLSPQYRQMLLEKIPYQFKTVSQIAAMFLADGNPNASFTDGNRPLHLILIKELDDEERFSLINLLLQGGADPNGKNNLGDTPLNIAAMANDMPALKTLLRAGANPNLANNKEETPLAWAIHHNNEESIKALREAGADPNLAKPIVVE